MIYQVRIETGNAAFHNDLTGEPDPGPELARILRSLADRVEDMHPGDLGEPIRLRDINGNKVGTAEPIEGDRTE